MVTTRLQSEIDDQLNKASEVHENGTRWGGMTYEEGVESALLWITGQRDDLPMEDE